MRCWNEEATIFEVEALNGPQSRQVFCCERSRLQFRRELMAVRQANLMPTQASGILLNLSIAHCSNCSSVISSVGGIS